MGKIHLYWPSVPLVSMIFPVSSPLFHSRVHGATHTQTHVRTYARAHARTHIHPDTHADTQIHTHIYTMSKRSPSQTCSHRMSRELTHARKHTRTNNSKKAGRVRWASCASSTTRIQIRLHKQKRKHPIPVMWWYVNSSNGAACTLYVRGGTRPKARLTGMPINVDRTHPCGLKSALPVARSIRYDLF